MDNKDEQKKKLAQQLSNEILAHAIEIYRRMDRGMLTTVKIKKQVVIVPGRPPENVELIIMKPSFHLKIIQE